MNRSAAGNTHRPRTAGGAAAAASPGHARSSSSYAQPTSSSANRDVPRVRRPSETDNLTPQQMRMRMREQNSLLEAERKAFDSLKQVLDNEKDAHRQFVDESAERMKRLEKRLEDARFSLHEKDQHARELQRQVALLQPRHDGDGDERLMMLLTQEREAWKEKETEYERKLEVLQYQNRQLEDDLARALLRVSKGGGRPAANEADPVKPLRDRISLLERELYAANELLRMSEDENKQLREDLEHVTPDAPPLPSDGPSGSRRGSRAQAASTGAGGLDRSGSRNSAFSSTISINLSKMNRASTVASTSTQGEADDGGVTAPAPSGELDDPGPNPFDTLRFNAAASSAATGGSHLQGEADTLPDDVAAVTGSSSSNSKQRSVPIPVPARAGASARAAGASNPSFLSVPVRTSRDDITHDDNDDVWSVGTPPPPPAFPDRLSPPTSAAAIAVAVRPVSTAEVAVQATASSEPEPANAKLQADVATVTAQLEQEKAIRASATSKSSAAIAGLETQVEDLRSQLTASEGARRAYQDLIEVLRADKRGKETQIRSLEEQLEAAASQAHAQSQGARGSAGGVTSAQVVLEASDSWVEVKTPPLGSSTSAQSKGFDAWRTPGSPAAGASSRSAVRRANSQQLLQGDHTSLSEAGTPQPPVTDESPGPSSPLPRGSPLPVQQGGSQSVLNEGPMAAASTSSTASADGSEATWAPTGQQQQRTPVRATPIGGPLSPSLPGGRSVGDLLQTIAGSPAPSRQNSVTAVQTGGAQPQPVKPVMKEADTQTTEAWSYKDPVAVFGVSMAGTQSAAAPAGAAAGNGGGGIRSISLQEAACMPRSDEVSELVLRVVSSRTASVMDSNDAASSSAPAGAGSSAGAQSPPITRAASDSAAGVGSAVPSPDLPPTTRKRLKDDLSAVMRASFLGHVRQEDALIGSLSVLAKKCRNLEREADRLREEKAEHKRQWDTDLAREAQLMQTHSQTLEELTGVQRQRDELKLDVEQLKDQIVKLQAQFDDSAHSKLQDDYAQLRKMYSDLLSRSTQLEVKERQTFSELSRLKDAHELAISTQPTRLKRSGSAATGTTEAELAAVKTRADQLQLQVEQAHSDLDRLREQLDARSKAHSDLEVKHQLLQQQRSEQLKSQNTLEKEVRAAEESSRSEAERSILTLENKQLRSRNLVLQSELRNLSKSLDTLKQQQVHSQLIIETSSQPSSARGRDRQASPVKGVLSADRELEPLDDDLLLMDTIQTRARSRSGSLSRSGAGSSISLVSNGGTGTAAVTGTGGAMDSAFSGSMMRSRSRSSSSRTGSRSPAPRSGTSVGATSGRQGHSSQQQQHSHHHRQSSRRAAEEPPSPPSAPLRGGASSHRSRSRSSSRGRDPPSRLTRTGSQSSVQGAGAGSGTGGGAGSRSGSRSRHSSRSRERSAAEPVQQSSIDQVDDSDSNIARKAVGSSSPSTGAGASVTTATIQAPSPWTSPNISRIPSLGGQSHIPLRNQLRHKRPSIDQSNSASLPDLSALDAVLDAADGNATTTGAAAGAGQGVRLNRSGSSNLAPVTSYTSASTLTAVPITSSQRPKVHRPLSPTLFSPELSSLDLGLGSSSRDGGVKASAGALQGSDLDDLNDMLADGTGDRDDMYDDQDYGFSMATRVGAAAATGTGANRTHRSEAGTGPATGYTETEQQLPPFPSLSAGAGAPGSRAGSASVNGSAMSSGVMVSVSSAGDHELDLEHEQHSPMQLSDTDLH